MTTEIERIIRKLAEAEWVRRSLPDFPGDPPGSIGTQSMEVPFASLRVKCQTCSVEGCWFPEPDPEKACWRLREIGFEGTTKDRILQEAEAWLDEKMKEKKP